MSPENQLMATAYYFKTDGPAYPEACRWREAVECMSLHPLPSDEHVDNTLYLPPAKMHIK